MKQPENINEVISVLDDIVKECLLQSNPLGLFAALYQKVTIQIKKGISADRFEDGSRMEKLDVVFANRYISAYRQYTSGKTPTLSWKTTFDASKRSDLMLLQHLFLGMNAHINLDLGIAAAQISSGDSIKLLEKDFIEVNKILFELIEEVQQDISNVSPFLGLIDLVAKKKDEQFAAFSMKAARKHAWTVAQRMALIKESGKDEIIESIDKYVVELNNLILKPGKLVSFIIWIICLVESKDVVKNIEVLRYIR